ncbi:MAG: hypothetical protein ATN35_09295 [Epulopiscium sp. Nele67-Bin004]|nr:MAG: hypothetical protein ATN35_09295 [Epulopiscium sp. Nele67-Bin004]
MYIVAIGASAGGIAAINEFFDNTPSDTGACFVIIQHLSPNHKSFMAGLLANRTLMNVVETQDNEEMLPNTVYLMTPGKNLWIEGNKLRVADKPQEEKVNLPINLFLKSLATQKKDKAIAVILSGAGADGSKGITCIKKNEGMVIAQDQTTAQFTSMPTNAVTTGCVDYIMTPAEMHQSIIKYITTGLMPQKGREVNTNMKNGTGIIDPINKIMMLIKDQKGINFADYKRSTIIRRIERRMNMLEISNIEDYVEHIDNYSDEIDTLHNEIFIGVTEFFRDEEAFGEIEQILPQIFASKPAGIGVRIWSAGCSTGEEAYSLAILIQEYLERTHELFNIKIFATDLNDIALSKASAGIYQEEQLVEVSDERRERFFEKKGEYYKVKQTIRDMVIFAKHNIITDPPFSKLDLLVCRNLLIYLEPQVQQSIFGIFDFSLNKDGYLFLGSSESLGNMGRYFEQISSKWKIFKHTSNQKLLMNRQFQVREFNNIPVDTRLSHNYNVSKKWNINNIDKSIDKIIQSLQDEYIPKGVIVNESYELIHSFGDVNEFIKIPANRISLNLLRMIRKDLSVAVGAALQNVFTSDRDFKYKNVNIHQDSEKKISLIAKIYVDEISNARYAVLLFEDKCHENYELKEHSFEFEEKAYERIADLESELKSNKEYLQALIEELESSNEELQSTNEELVSSNEELQNTNEELQSVNEELYTVNGEYHQKIEELTQVNDDINNLLAMTEITAIFLDKRMRIRRFTPSVKRVINLIESDVGRRLGDISTNMHYPTFIEDIQAVLNHLVPSEQIATGNEGQHYRVTITPYISAESNVKGVIINIADIPAMSQEVVS